MDNERRIGAFVLDVIQNGHWAIQHDVDGALATKPPMLTWLASLATLASGGLSRFSVYLPGALGWLAAALVVLRHGTLRFGWAAGFLGALALLCSAAGDEAVQSARYDPLFAGAVALAAFSALDAWESGRGWARSWGWSAIATLVKGPLGLVLAAGGLFAAPWERRSGGRETPLPPRRRGTHAAGVALFLLVCGGWFTWAYHAVGWDLVECQLAGEVVGHAFVGDAKEGFAHEFWRPSVACLKLLLPWSLLAPAALLRVFRRPDADASARRAERFLTCWLLFGLLLFGLGAHQRSRLALPILPPLALLCGRELARAARAWSPRRLLRTATIVALLFLAGIGVYRQELLRGSREVQRTLSVRALAEDVERTLGPAIPLTYVKAPNGLQFALATRREEVAPARAAELLRGDVPAFVLVGSDSGLAAIDAALGPDRPPNELRTVPMAGDESLHLLSNHPRLEWPERVRAEDGPMLVELFHARPVSRRAGELEFRRTAPQGSVSVRNVSDAPLTLRVHLSGKGLELRELVVLGAGEVWDSAVALGLTAHATQ